MSKIYNNFNSSNLKQKTFHGSWDSWDNNRKTFHQKPQMKRHQTFTSWIFPMFCCYGCHSGTDSCYFFKCEISILLIVLLINISCDHSFPTSPTLAIIFWVLPSLLFFSYSFNFPPFSVNPQYSPLFYRPTQ